MCRIVFVFENACPARFEANKSFFRNAISLTLSAFSFLIFFRIMLIALIAYSLDLSFEFLFQIASKEWLSASNVT